MKKYKVLRDYPVNTYPNVRTIKAPDPIRKGEIVEGEIIEKHFFAAGGADGATLVKGIEVNKGIGSAFIKESDLEPVSGNVVSKVGTWQFICGCVIAVLVLIALISLIKENQ